VKALAADEQADSELRTLARALAENYKYPVDFQVLDTTGKLYAQGEANHMRRSYRDVLLSGLE
jgi:hypothetical protein